MSGKEVLLQAGRAVAEQGIRASLSAIGVLFGVATIVAALAVGEGARRRAYDDVAALGIDNVFVRSRPAVPGYPAPARFTPADVAAVAGAVEHDAVVAAARGEPAQVRRGSIAAAADVSGVTAEWHAIADAAVAFGRWLDAADVRERRRVVVLSAALAHALFGDAPAIGEQVHWRGQPFRVVGVLEASRRAGARASAFLPLTAADMRLSPTDDTRHAQEIALLAIDGASAEAVARNAAASLASRGHRLDDLEIIVPRAVLRAKLEAQRTFDWVLFGIGLIAVGISGIGIMNIMLASVAARTGEIGIRRAAGARRRDVLAQFAAEAALICVAGGLAGAPLGALLAVTIASAAGWPVAVSIQSIALALVTALTVGLVSGIYPARRAARLDPVVAIRG